MTHPVDKVKQVLDERGWCKGRFENSKGEVCLTMAISYAAGRSTPDYANGLMHEIRKTMEYALKANWDWESLVSFNDDSTVNRSHIDLLIEQTKEAWDNAS